MKILLVIVFFTNMLIAEMTRGPIEYEEFENSIKENVSDNSKIDLQVWINDEKITNIDDYKEYKGGDIVKINVEAKKDVYIHIVANMGDCDDKSVQYMIPMKNGRYEYFLESNEKQTIFAGHVAEPFGRELFQVFAYEQSVIDRLPKRAKQKEICTQQNGFCIYDEVFEQNLETKKIIENSDSTVRTRGSTKKLYPDEVLVRFSTKES